MSRICCRPMMRWPRGNRCGTYLAVCGALVPASSLPSSLCPPGCQYDCALYCPQCIREVLRDAAESGKRSNEPQGDEPEAGDTPMGAELPDPVPPAPGGRLEPTP